MTVRSRFLTAFAMCAAAAATSVLVVPGAAAAPPSWTVAGVPLPPNASAGLSSLDAVSCPLEGWCYAVGRYSTADGDRPLVATVRIGEPVVVHRPPVPDDIDGNAGLLGISCWAARRCVSVGFYAAGPYAVLPVIEELTSHGWVLEDFPDPWSSPTSFDRVACTVVTCVVSGSTGRPALTPVLVDRVPGQSWRLPDVFLPTGMAIESVIPTCAATASYCVASADAQDVYTGERASLFVYQSYDGWTGVHFPHPNGAPGPTYVGDISCSSGTTCVALGEYGSANGYYPPLAERLTNGDLRVQRLTVPTGFGRTVWYQNGVACVPTGTCVGYVGSVRGTLQYASVPRSPGVLTGADTTHYTLADVDCSEAGACAEVGTSPSGLPGAATYRPGDGSWLVREFAALPGGATSGELRAVSCTEGTCVAVGTSGSGPLAVTGSGIPHS